MTRPGWIDDSAPTWDDVLAWRMETRSLYSPTQPRVPAGSPNGGRWTDGDMASSAWTNAGSDANNERLGSLLQDAEDAGIPQNPDDDSAWDQSVSDNETRILTEASRFIGDRMVSMLGQPDSTGERETEFAAEVIQQWQGSAPGSAKPINIGMQRAAARVFDLPPDTLDVVPTPDEDRGRLPDTEWADAYTRAEYAATQQWLKDHGITGYVTLYRGVLGQHTRLNAGTQTVTMRPVTSWSLDDEQARNFTAYARQGHPDHPAILVARIPVERILSLPLTGRGALQEREVVVIGGPAQVDVQPYGPWSDLKANADRRTLPNIDADARDAEWLRRAWRIETRSLYSADQPRVPAGSPDGGQWTDGGAIRPGQSPEADDMGRVLTGALLHEARDTEALGDRLHNFGEITGEERSHLSYRAAVALADRVVQSRRLTDADWEELRSVFADDPANDPEQQQRLARQQVEAIQERWRNTSGDGDFEAAKNQLAVKREFGLDDAPMSHLGSEDDYHQFHGDRMQDDGGPLNRAIARAEYEATQDWLKAHGVTGSVTVYRGLLGQVSRPPDGEQDVTLQPASSWSVDRKVAETFANNWGDGELTTGHPGMPMRPYIVTAQVPVSRIFSVGATGRAAINEGEVIVLGGKARVLVTPWRHTPKGWGGQ